MIRVVLDTNIVVSALLNPSGPPAQVFLHALAATELRMCVSGSIFAEYEDVLRRPRLRRSPEEIASALAAIRSSSALWVAPSQPVTACIDPRDDMFLECAQAARAQFLVTGNLRHFPSFWMGAQVVGTREFLELLP